jgi:hypothetical protein
LFALSIFSLFVGAVYQGRVHGIVYIIYTDVPDTHAMPCFLAEINTYIEPVRGGKAIVVAVLDIISFLNTKTESVSSALPPDGKTSPLSNQNKRPSGREEFLSDHCGL